MVRDEDEWPKEEVMGNCFLSCDMDSLEGRNNVIFDKKESVNLVGTIEIGKYWYDQWARCVISKIQPKIGDIHPKSRGEVNN